MNIYKTIIPILAVTACVAAKAAPFNWGTTDASLTRQGDYLAVDFNLDIKDINVTSDRAVLLTPCLVSGNDTVTLPSVGIYGRNRYLYYQRKSPDMISGPGETVIKIADRPDSLHYKRMVPYSDNLDDASLIVKYTSYGCCAKPIDRMAHDTGASYRAFRPWQFYPVYVAASPVAEKTDSLVDRAYVDFVVNRTDIKPDYHNNYNELGKIRKSIEIVMDDPDCTITGIWLKGFASPEGKYDHNTMLAKGRTQALKDYIKNLYNFPSTLISTDFQPEDWSGLREFIAASNIDNRTELLAIIDKDMNPDDKEALIKKSYPTQYAFLLDQVYPSLRHTDYRIDYTIRRFTDIDEIRKVYETQPRKLDLNELYLLASQCEPGSPEFISVYQTAVKMYPNDPTANLNAANAALQAGDLQAAKDYLQRAGNSDEAQFSRAILALLSNDYTSAATLLRQASAAGINDADNILEQMKYNRVIN